MQFRGEKYLNTFIVTNANDCPNLLSHGATFRMGVLLPNYPVENVVKGENVPNFKFGVSAGTSTGTSSNVFQILQDLWLKQYKENSSDSSKSRTSRTSTTYRTCTTTQPTPLMTYGSPQPIRIQVWPHPLLVCMSHRLLPGPQFLPEPHPVQDNQPL